MKESLRAFMHGLIDYAGLFPSANLPLNEAIDDYIKHLKGENSWMLGKFIIPISKLDDLDVFVTLFDDIGGFVWIILGLGIIRVLAPILAGKGSKIVFWIVVALSVLKLVESFLATVGDPKESLGWYWYLILTGGIEVGVLIHLLNPKARAELSNQ